MKQFIPPLPKQEHQISIDTIIQMRMAYDNLKETDQTKAIIETLDGMILTFVKSLTPTQGN